MSEQILKALMQLFAIIARPDSIRKDRRIVVESFLDRLLNKERVAEYITLFDHSYKDQQDKKKERGKRALTSGSVRVLKICTEINDQLTQQQKIIVLSNLFEFVKSDAEEISEQELEFIRTVAEIFHISSDEYNLLKSFIISRSDSDLPDSDKYLLVKSKEDSSKVNTKFVKRESFEGKLLILKIDSANIYLLRYLGIDELYMNSQLLQPDKVNVLKSGSSIRNHVLKPVYFSDIISSFIDDVTNSKITFEAKNIHYKFKNGKTGLEPLSFSEETGRMVGIMGASGAGKSTLVNILNGSVKPTSGEVYINSYDIHKDNSELEGIIGFVSQDDLLIEELSVYQNLYYNAKLCFDNYTEERIEETVNTTLHNLGLAEIKDIQVGNPLNKKISGGQRKRLNIALELIREPAVLFLDEPTSGLSSRDSENIMDLLKELALKGKLVFVVIHQPSSDIFKMFDRLLILDVGGYLIYNGDPIESITYFKEQIHHANWSESECRICGNVNPEQIFNIVEANVINEYGQLTYDRKKTPKEWAEKYKEFSRPNTKNEKKDMPLPEISFKIPSRFKQFLIFVKRDILSKLSNTQYLFINLLEAPVLAFILSFIIRYFDESEGNAGYTLESNTNLPVYIFMSVIVAIFIGLSVSAEEIIKDRKILKRESFLNLSWSSYLLSKVAIMFMLSAIQAATYVIIGNSIIGIKGMFFYYWLMLFSAWATSNIMGLVISDSFKTVVTIYILIPFLVIPQILLSGVIVKYEEINPKISSPDKIPFYGEVITARWAYEGLAVHQFIENDYQKNFYTYDKIISKSNFKKNYWLPELENKIDFVTKYYKDAKETELVNEAFKLLYNEISHENKTNIKIKFDDIDKLNINSFNDDAANNLNEYKQIIRKYYVAINNNAIKLKDNDIIKMQDSMGKDNFLVLKQNYYNDKLKEFVENKNRKTRIIEFENQFYQKIDPIYLDPENKLIKAHFYAPNKLIFNKYISTFWANLIVLFFIGIILYVILYFRLLRKLINYIEEFSSRPK